MAVPSDWNRVEAGRFEVIDDPHGVRPAAPQRKIPYLGLAWKRKWWLLFFAVLGSLGGVAWVVVREPQYVSSGTLEVLGFNQSFMGLNQVDPQASETYSASASNIQTQIRILTSRSMMGRVMERLSLETAPVTAAPDSVFTKIRARIPIGRKEPLEKSKEAMMIAAQTLSVRAVGTTRLVEMSCRSTSPEIAAAFLNTLAAEHISQSLAGRSSATQRTSQWMEAQLEEAKARLQQAGEKLQGFVRESGMDFFPEQSTLANSKLRQLQGDLSTIQADRIAKQSRWELAKSTPWENLPAVLNDATLMGIKGQIMTVRREMATLTTTLTPEHAKVQRLQAQLTELEQTLEKEKSGLLKRLESEYQEALRREKLLAGAYSAQTRSLGSQAERTGQYELLRRDVETAQQAYNNLLIQSGQAALVSMVPTSNLRVVDQAMVSSEPVSPEPWRDIPVGALLGMLLCYGIFLLVEMARNRRMMLRFDAPGHSAGVLGVPELGVIPSVEDETGSRRRLLGPLKRLGPAKSKGEIIDLKPEGEPTEEPAPILDWRSRSPYLAESFRNTLTSILRTKPKDHQPVYVMTSAGPGEGKTTITANLGVVMAESGLRVLLVDADLRCSRLHKLFGMGRLPGLSELLTDSGSRELKISAFCHPTGIERLWLMPHGTGEVESPSVLFFSSRMKEILQEVQGQYDVVLVDTAPALQFADARLIGAYSDGVVLVVRANHTSRESAMVIRERLTADGIPVLGTILNDWAPEADSETNYYYGGYDYSKGRKDK